jgi:hypothetical protein
MKKSIILSVFGGLLLATSLQAQTHIYVSGSTAFRSNAYRAIRSLYDAGFSENEGALTGTVDAPTTNNSGAGVMTWSGTMSTVSNLNSAGTVVIHASWTGSVQGIHNVTTGESLNFLANGTQGDTNVVSHASDMCFSDVYQSSSPYGTPVLNDTNVAIQPFVYVLGKGTGPGQNVNNVTIQQLQQAIGDGVEKLSYFTGNTNDANAYAFLTGRTKDSGTRVTQIADGLYIGGVNLYQGNGTTATKMTANQVVNFVNYGPGFTGGGAMVGNLVLGAGTNALIGYVGVADALTAAGAGCKILSYNGEYCFPWTNGVSTTNAFYTAGSSPDYSSVITGKYSFWGPEHVLVKSTGSAAAQALCAALPPAIDNDLTNATVVPVTAIRLSAMGTTGRGFDGGPIHP